MTSLNDIRAAFLKYFEQRDHSVVQSSPLVPRNDATLLFTNSGMVQFKNIFTGLETRDYVRAATSQKCIRAGGKHNDLDNVGYTTRHHTFFEMLGNFSFGDYFKEQAIFYCWDLITREFDIPKDRLLCTVYHDDDEAAALWQKVAGFTDDRIIRIATSDNFWSMGNTGPCGPCSEIYYDYGEDVPGGPPGSPDEDGERFVEMWNLVFMQFDRTKDGTMHPLPRPCIDTGMGLERIGALLQGTRDNFLTDLFRSLIEISAQFTSTDPYGAATTHHRVIADHLRSTAFLIAEGVLPSNEGRGYVLRRIMRRAMRHAHFLEYEGTLLHDLFPQLVNQMGNAFPELAQNSDMIAETIKGEELRFKATLSRGLEILNREIKALDSGQSLSGATAFKLYDTYGFPLDLTQDVLREKDLTVDVAEFDQEMTKQKERARASWVGSGEIKESAIWFKLLEEHGRTEFLGYEFDQAQGMILALTDGKTLVTECQSGHEIHLIANQTPFYAEAGGQVGDQGHIKTETGLLEVADTRRLAGIFVHHCKVLEGTVQVGTNAELIVEASRRDRIKKNHSATHLLNEALREVLGRHVVQRGSLNDENRLRFDFSHGHPLTLEELSQVEDIVNQKIQENTPVQTTLMELEKALKIGAQAMFGEKYDSEVRVVSMGQKSDGANGVRRSVFSIELCGGTHVKSTGEIGWFVTTGETSSSAGIRRIDALTGSVAYDYLRSRDHLLAEVALQLKTPPAQIPDKVASLIKERNQLKKELENLHRERLASQFNKDESEYFQTEFSWGTYSGRIVKGLPPAEISALMDAEKTTVKSGVVVMVSEFAQKASVAVGITKDLTGRFSAIDLIQEITPLVGGKGGGGRPDFARGGGPDTSDLKTVLSKVRDLIQEDA